MYSLQLFYLSQWSGFSNEEEVVVAEVSLNLESWYVMQWCQLHPTLQLVDVLWMKEQGFSQNHTGTNYNTKAASKVDHSFPRPIYYQHMAGTVYVSMHTAILFLIYRYMNSFCSLPIQVIISHLHVRAHAPEIYVCFPPFWSQLSQLWSGVAVELK